MRSKNPDLMNSILAYITDYILKNHHSPSTTVIAQAFHIGRSTAHRYLSEMNEKNMLVYNGRYIETPKTECLLSSSPADVYEDAIPCGPLSEIMAEPEAVISLPEYIFGKGDLFVVRTTGDSMINAGIEPGSFVVVEKTRNVKPGDIVVALSNGANTLKRLLKDDKGYILHPENDTMADIRVTDLSVQGVARFVIKELS